MLLYDDRKWTNLSDVAAFSYSFIRRFVGINTGDRLVELRFRPKNEKNQPHTAFTYSICKLFVFHPIGQIHCHSPQSHIHRQVCIRSHLPIPSWIFYFRIYPSIWMDPRLFFHFTCHVESRPVRMKKKKTVLIYMMHIANTIMEWIDVAFFDFSIQWWTLAHEYFNR